MVVGVTVMLLHGVVREKTLFEGLSAYLVVAVLTSVVC